MAEYQPLLDWLVAAYPGDLPMPVKSGSKAPLFRHTEGAWHWEDVQLHISEDAPAFSGGIGILLHKICVVDVDDKQQAAALEARFPVLLQCPAEDTKRGRHYFFECSSLCRAGGYFNQASSVLPHVDFKTKHANGTASFLVVAPSAGKKWLRAPWALGDTLLPIPDALLKAVAVPKTVLPSVHFCFQDGSDFTCDSNSQKHLYKLGMIVCATEGMGQHETAEIHMGVGTADLLQKLLFFLQHRCFQHWPVDVQAVRQLADYLYCQPNVLHFLAVDSPACPAAWQHAMGQVSPIWAQAPAAFATTNSTDTPTRLVQVCDMEQILYREPCRDQAWLLQGYGLLGLKTGTPMLRPDMAAFARATLPGPVQQLLEAVPCLVLAGGAALHVACPHLSDTAALVPADYDLYMHGIDSEQEAQQILHTVLQTLPTDTVAAQTGSAVTFVCYSDGVGTEKISIQVVLRRYVSVQHILTSFDLAPCQVAYFQGKVWATDLWCSAVEQMAMPVNFWTWNTASVPRVFKYYSKGFEVLVPGLQRQLFSANAVQLDSPPVPGIASLFRVEKHLLLHLWHNKSKQRRVGRPCRSMTDRSVRLFNFWGDRFQSGYSEMVQPTQLKYIVRALVSRALVWLGLRPVKTVVRGTPFEASKCAVPAAGSAAFYQTPPNFKGLYASLSCFEFETELCLWLAPCCFHLCFDVLTGSGPKFLSNGCIHCLHSDCLTSLLLHQAQVHTVSDGKDLGVIRQHFRQQLLPERLELIAHPL